MIRKLLYILIPFAALAALTSATMSDNGKAARTGSPGEADCTDCHGDFTLNSGGGSISISAPGMSGNQYTPGQTYTMSVTVSRGANSLFGVGIEALTSTNANAGTLNITDAASTQIKSATISGVSRRNIVDTLGGGAGSGSKVFNFSWTAPTAGTGNVTFYFAGVAADADGNESGDYVYRSSQVYTEVSCATPAQPGAISGNVALCSGGSSTLSVAAVSGATSYTWTLPSGWTGTSTTNSINVTAGASSGNISVTANNACGASPASTVAATGTTYAVSASVHDMNCNGSNNGSIVLTPNGGTAPYTYSWAPSGGSSATASNLAAGTYTATITDANGCTATASGTVWEPPVLAISAGSNQSTCAGNTSALTLGGAPSAGGGVAPYTYLQSPATGLSSATASNPTVTPSSTGTYTLTVTDDYGCSASSQTTITVNTPTTPTVTLNGNGFTLDASAASSYQWYLNSNLIGGATSQSYTPTQDGSYSVMTTDANGCSATSVAFVYTILGIDGATLTVSELYPNPASGFISFNYENAGNDAVLYLVDMTGRTVLSQALTTGKNIVDVSAVAEGSYFLTTHNGKENSSMRVFINR